MNGIPKLDTSEIGVLVIDMQERLFGAMPRKIGARHAHNVEILVAGARELEIPIVVSEQYPQGLGPTLPGILESAGDTEPLTKTSFSCWNESGLREAIEASGRHTWLVAGMETHVCVYQTVRDLVDAGHRVHVITDACLSRHSHHYRNGLELCAAAGALNSNVETALFELVGGKDHEAFKKISSLVR